MEKDIFYNTVKGGQGSGNFGHAGRPGEQGGSQGMDNPDAAAYSPGEKVTIGGSNRGAGKSGKIVRYDRKNNFYVVDVGEYESIEVHPDNLRMTKGGAGSGNFGHVGRPGERGGSSAGDGGPAGAPRVAPDAVDQGLRGKHISVEGQFPIAVAEIASKLKLGVEKDQVWKQLNGKKATEIAARQIQREMRGRGNIKVGQIKFGETDSGNISHAVAYYKVPLQGPYDSIKQIAGEDKAIYADFSYANVIEKRGDSMGEDKFFDVVKGGAGSGNFGHEGRPGERGGSGPGGPGAGAGTGSPRAEEKHPGGGKITGRNPINRVSNLADKLLAMKDPVYKQDGKDYQNILHQLRTKSPGGEARARAIYSDMDTVVRDDFARAYTNDYKDGAAMRDMGRWARVEFNMPIPKSEDPMYEATKGGPGSGNFGHGGRPGERGGSSSEGGGGGERNAIDGLTSAEREHVLTPGYTKPPLDKKGEKEYAEISTLYTDPELRATALAYNESTRDLDFKGSPANAGKFVDQAEIVGPYNDFDVEKAEYVVKAFGEDAQYKLGRENSVVVYVTPAGSEVTRAIKDKGERSLSSKDFEYGQRSSEVAALYRAKADEISLQPNGDVRLWWD